MAVKFSLDWKHDLRVPLERASALFVLVAMSCSADGEGSGTGGYGTGARGSGASGGSGAAGGFGGATGGSVGTSGSGPGGSGPGGSGPGGSGGLGGGGGLGGSGGIGATGGIAGTGGTDGSAGTGVGGSGVGGSAGTACTAQPGGMVSDYGARGPFAVTKVNNTGPGGSYTIFRPTDLNTGFKHPPVAWGNGLSTTPEAYVELLSTVASHGFVVIGSNSTGITAAQVKSGLDWMLQQNSAAGDFQGKLVVECASAIGYSMGGGAVLTASQTSPSVKAIVAMHNLAGSSSPNAAPLLIMTSTDDTFVTKAANATPTYNRAGAQQPAILATLNCPAAGMPTCRSVAGIAGHAIPLADAGGERAPLVAWLRWWIYGDLGARGYFYGADCTLCKAPWLDIQRKNHMW